LIRLKGFEKLTNVDEALSKFLKTLKPTKLSPEKISVMDALGRVAANDVIAPVDLPSFDRSAVDGYAVRATDLTEASQFKPKKLKLTEQDNVGQGQAKQVWTGNSLPRGADAVVMLEYTKPVSQSIEIIAAVTPNENVSKKGEDIKKGDIAVNAGTRLMPHHIGLLAALGVVNVDVVRKPKVAIISTGDELVELGKKPQLSQIINSNRFVIEGLCRELGSETFYLGIAKDNEKDIKAKILEGLRRGDAVITTGGTSVGIADLVTIAVDKLGKPGIIVHGVALRPGMPTALGILEGKPLFILSGYSVAATIGFEVFARPTLLRMLGAEIERRPILKAKLTRRVAGTLGRRVYLRVKAFEKAGELYAEPVRTKGSGLLSSMVKANGYVIIPENREGLAEDETVAVQVFGPLTA
jgi:molybdopterin molybdotransferase